MTPGGDSLLFSDEGIQGEEKAPPGRTRGSREPGQEPTAGGTAVLPAFPEGGSSLPLEIWDLRMNGREEKQEEGRGGNHGCQEEVLKREE